MESHRRSVAKSLSWRVFALIITAVIARAVTGSVAAGLAIGGFDFLFKLGTFYIHERLWLRVKWGQIDSGIVSEGGGL